jgi:hypothetical protein
MCNSKVASLAQKHFFHEYKSTCLKKSVASAAGHKTWFVRPCAQAADWESSPPVLEKGKEGVVEAPDGRGGLRLRIQCEEVYEP